MNKKLLTTLALCFVIFLTGCTKKSEPTDTLAKILKRGYLIVGIKVDAKPFGYLNEHGQPSGYDVDLSKEIAKSILGNENKVKFVPVTSSNRILKLSKGEVDMLIATMTITKQRKAVVDFSQPYYITGQSILVNDKSEIHSIAELNGKKTIIIFGSTAEDDIRKHAPNSEIIGFKTYTSGYNALKANKADALLGDNSILLGISMDDSNVKLLPQKYSSEPYAIAFRQESESQNLKSKVNFTLDFLQKSGKLNSLKHKWIKN